MKHIIDEFKAFIIRGNVLDLAVGVIIGAAFQKIISSMVNDMIMPIISLCIGGIDFTNWFIALDGKSYDTLVQAQSAGSPTLNYGTFITEVINFLIMAFVIFMMVKIMNTLAHNVKKEASKAVVDHHKQCPYCKSNIDTDATRCPHCTSVLTS